MHILSDDSSLTNNSIEMLVTRLVFVISQVALVKWTESVGLTLVHRDLTSMTVKTPVTGSRAKYEILQTFPFTSETKRMGIIVKVRLEISVIFFLI